jgi:perosamine synthetase
MIPYNKQSIDQKDIKAVEEVLLSDWLTTGPKVAEFERAIADYVDTKHAVAVNSGTAALHCAMYALGVGPGDEVIVPPMTFAATANCIVFQGGKPVFVDIDKDTLLINPDEVEKSITDKTKAVVAVDYSGHPCDYESLRNITDKYGLALLADSCHALGGEYKGKKVGTLADLTVFSFHPVKHITTGEGGMVTTDNEEFADSMYTFRNHGISTDSHQREYRGTWYYEMVDLGYNYRLSDIQCALGINQIKQLPDFLARRRGIAGIYNEAFSISDEITPLVVRDDLLHAYHLYVVRLNRKHRNQVFNVLREKGIGVNVHYIPVHLHPFYRKRFNTGPGLCKAAEEAYDQILSLPIYPDLGMENVERVARTVKEVVSGL